MEVKESLEAKVVRLEVEIQQQVLLFTYCARIFFVPIYLPINKDIRIAKLEVLEGKVQQQEAQLIALKNGHPSRAVFVKNKPTEKKNTYYRTCLEMYEDDPSLVSGMYYIDPDGQDVGDGPIHVYCDMSISRRLISRSAKRSRNELLQLKLIIYLGSRIITSIVHDSPAENVLK